MHYVIRTIGLQLFTVELITATLLFFRQLEKRKLWWLLLLIGLALLIGLTFPLVILKDHLLTPLDTAQYSDQFFALTYGLGIASELIMFAAYIGVIWKTFAISGHQALFIGCAAYSARNIARCAFTLYQLLTGTLAPFSMTALLADGSIFVFLILYAAVYTGCYFVFFRRYQSGDENFLNSRILSILLALILANMVLSAVNAPRNSSEALALYHFTVISRILLCVMGLVMQFVVLDTVKLRFQQSQMEHLISTQKEHYEIAKKSIDTVNINAHDLKHQIALINAAIRETGNSGQIENELDHMQRMIEMVDTAYRTGNKALDVTLTEKARICRLKEISFSAIADGTALGFMMDVDIYTLLGNALDNGIEAAEQIPSPEGRVISVSLRKIQGMVSLHVENTFDQPPKFENGLPQTRKRDKDFHGFGVKSIVRVTEKYGGNMKMHVENALFCLDVLLPEQ